MDIKDRLSRLSANLQSNMESAILDFYTALRESLPNEDFLEITDQQVSQEEGCRRFTEKFPHIYDFIRLVQENVLNSKNVIEKGGHTNMKIDRALIISGGIATRFRPITYGLPKPLLPVNGKTLTENIMDIVKKHGVRKITLGLAHGAERIMGYFGGGEKFGVSMDYTIEKIRLGTAGPLFLMKRPTKPFLMINGDNLFDLDIDKMHSFLEEKEAVGVIALTSVDDSMKGGAVKLDGDRITGFFEKLQAEEARKTIGPAPYWLNSGYYILSPKVFDYLPKEQKFTMMENHIFPRLAAEGKLFGFKWKGQWHDSGTPLRYKEIIDKWKLG